MFKANMADGPFDACCKAVFTKIETAGLAGITEPDYAQRGGIRKHGQTQTWGRSRTLWQTIGA